MTSSAITGAGSIAVLVTGPIDRAGRKRAAADRRDVTRADPQPLAHWPEELELK